MGSDQNQIKKNWKIKTQRNPQNFDNLERESNQRSQREVIGRDILKNEVWSNFFCQYRADRQAPKNICARLCVQNFGLAPAGNVGETTEGGKGVLERQKALEGQREGGDRGKGEDTGTAKTESIGDRGYDPAPLSTLKE